jgi:hypothetical protein
MPLANSQVAALKASEIQYAVRTHHRQPALQLTSQRSRTNETSDSPFPPMKRNRVQIQIRPPPVTFCKSRLGLGHAQPGTFELHVGSEAGQNNAGCPIEVGITRDIKPIQPHHRYWQDQVKFPSWTENICR